MNRTTRNVGIAVVGVLAIGLGWHFFAGEAPARAADPAPAPPQVPVTTAATKVQDVPVYVEGLGTVSALNVVEISAQVSGPLIALPIKEGQEVHKGDIVAEIDPRPYQAALDQAKAQRGEDLALLKSGQQDLQRYATLAKREFAPVQQVDDQAASVQKQIAAIAADTAAIETATINLGYCVIRAPIDGRVSLYQLDVGNLVQANSASSNIVSITQDKPITVVFTLPEDEFGRVQEAMARGPVEVDISSNDGTKKLAQGTLLAPNNTIDTTTGTISLKAIFANEDDHLWPGQFVGARVRVNTYPKAVIVPTPAIEHGPNGLFVYYVKPDQTVDTVAVDVRYEDNGQSVVSKGLTGNETVVVGGQSRLSPGVHVKATYAAQSSQAPASAQSAGQSPT